MTRTIPTTKILSGIPPWPVLSHTPGKELPCLHYPVVHAAALPAALAVPAVAACAEPDPIYAAIEKYRIAEDAFLARANYEDGQN